MESLWKGLRFVPIPPSCFFGAKNIIGTWKMWVFFYFCLLLNTRNFSAWVWFCYFTHFLLNVFFYSLSNNSHFSIALPAIHLRAYLLAVLYWKIQYLVWIRYTLFTRSAWILFCQYLCFLSAHYPSLHHWYSFIHSCILVYQIFFLNKVWKLNHFLLTFSPHFSV